MHYPQSDTHPTSDPIPHHQNDLSSPTTSSHQEKEDLNEEFYRSVKAIKFDEL